LQTKFPLNRIDFDTAYDPMRRASHGAVREGRFAREKNAKLMLKKYFRSVDLLPRIVISQDLSGSVRTAEQTFCGDAGFG
jgi:hypothetical protein